MQTVIELFLGNPLSVITAVTAILSVVISVFTLIQNSVISAFDIVHGIPSLSLLFLLYPQMGKYCMERARIGCRFRRKTSQNAII